MTYCYREQVSSTVVDPDSAILPNAPTDRHGVNATAEHGSYLVRTGSALNGPSTCDSLDYPDWFSSPVSLKDIEGCFTVV